MSLRWFNKSSLTGQELAQLSFLRATYQQTLGPDPLPVELHYDETTHEATHKPQKANFQKTFWAEKLGKGPLREFADQMIGLICSFQLTRAQRTNPFKSGYVDDPVNLFCEELKAFLVNVVSMIETWTDGDHGTLRLVEARIRLLGLVEPSKLFPAEDGAELPLMSAVGEVRLILQDKVVPRILVEIANYAATEHLRMLVAGATDVLTHGCQILASIFRGVTPVDQCYTLGSLVEPGRKESREILATESGRLLQSLESSEFFSELFSLKSARTEAPVLRGSRVTNPFLEDLDPRPGSFVGSAAPVDDIVRRLQSQQSGVETSFRNRTDLLLEFVHLHGWLYEVAALIVAFERSRKLAGAGGNLLGYGLTNVALNHLLTCVDAILQRVKVCVEKLFEAGNAEKINLLKLNGGKTVWMGNFAYSSSYKDRLIWSIKSCVKAAGDVRLEAKKVTPAGQLENAEQETESFLELAQGILSHQADFLEIPGFESPRLGKFRLNPSASLPSLPSSDSLRSLRLTSGVAPVSPESAADDASQLSEDLSDTQSIDEETLAKLEEEKLQWFMSLIQGDPFRGGSSYQLTEDEAEQLQESHRQQQQQQQQAGVAPKLTASLPAKPEGKDKDKDSKGKAAAAAPLPGKTLPEPDKNGKKERPFAHARRKLREKFIRERKSQANDPESKQALEDIARRKSELLMQEKLQKVMSGTAHTSYDLTEHERSMIEVDNMQRNQQMQSEEEKLRALSAGSALAFGDSASATATQGCLDDATAASLLQQKYAKFMVQLSQAPNADFSLYTETDPSAQAEIPVPVQDGDYESMAPVYDEATAQEIFNQKLALFQQQLTMTPEKEISSYTDVKEKERLQLEEQRRQQKAAVKASLTIVTGEPGTPVHDGEYKALAPSYDDATAQELFQQKFALFSQQMATTPDTEVSSYSDAAELSAYLESSMSPAKSAASAKGGPRKPKTGLFKSGDSAGLVSTKTPESGKSHGSLGKTKEALLRSRSEGDSKQLKSALKKMEARPSKLAEQLKVPEPDDEDDLDSGEFPEVRRKLRFSEPDALRGKSRRKNSPGKGESDGGEDEEEEEEEGEHDPPPSRSNSNAGLSERKFSWRPSFLANLFSPSKSTGSDSPPRHRAPVADDAPAESPALKLRPSPARSVPRKAHSHTVVASSINAPDEDEDEGDGEADSAPRSRSSSAKKTSGFFSWSPFSDSKSQPAKEPEVFSPASKTLDPPSTRTSPAANKRQRSRSNVEYSDEDTREEDGEEMAVQEKDRSASVIYKPETTEKEDTGFRISGLFSWGSKNKDKEATEHEKPGREEESAENSLFTKLMVWSPFSGSQQSTPLQPEPSTPQRKDSTSSKLQRRGSFKRQVGGSEDPPEDYDDDASELPDDFSLSSPKEKTPQPPPVSRRASFRLQTPPHSPESTVVATQVKSQPSSRRNSMAKVEPEGWDPEPGTEAGEMEKDKGKGKGKEKEKERDMGNAEKPPSPPPVQVTPRHVHGQPRVFGASAPQVDIFESYQSAFYEPRKMPLRQGPPLTPPMITGPVEVVDARTEDKGGQASDTPKEEKGWTNLFGLL